MKEVKVEQVTALAPAVSLSALFYELRAALDPPLTGTGLTVAILDSGIKKTHQCFDGGKVVHEANFSGAQDCSDHFDHGTGVASLIAGGRHAADEEAGVSPGAYLMNIKVIDDEGVGTDESVILGIEEVCNLVQAARLRGLYPTEALYPNLMNLSFGGDDDNDPDNPIRTACRQASLEYGIDVIAAAGNAGPKISSIMLPASEPEVIAVGAIESEVFHIWERSARGPTKAGDTKPDFVTWGTNLNVASSKSDTEYTVKSGTSFSAPIVAGLTGLIWETGRRIYGDDWYLRWRDIKSFAPFLCLKPEDAPLKKDNAYGYGLPALGSMIGSLGSGNSSSMTTSEMTAGVMGLGLIGMMVNLIGGTRYVS
jgi:serine protease AprX